MSEMRDIVIALHLEGKTNGQIRLATGLSRGTIGGHIGRWRKQQGITYTGGAVKRDFSKTQTDDTLRKAGFTFDKEREAEKRQRENDARFVVALARAFQRGDHLPKGTIPTLTLIG